MMTYAAIFTNIWSLREKKIKNIFLPVDKKQFFVFHNSVFSIPVLLNWLRNNQKLFIVTQLWI